MSTFFCFVVFLAKTSEKFPIKGTNKRKCLKRTIEKPEKKCSKKTRHFILVCAIKSKCHKACVACFQQKDCFKFIFGAFLTEIVGFTAKELIYQNCTAQPTS